MVIEAIQKQSAETACVDVLRRHIIQGELLPGERITETPLSESLGVSRGTLRVALSQLVKENLVIKKPYSGWMVAMIDSRELSDLYYLRAALESMAARILCETLTPADAATLRHKLRDYEHAVNSDDFATVVDKDYGLHQAIIELTRNKFIIDHYRLVSQQIRLFVASTHRISVGGKKSMENHRAIVEALLRQDEDAAESLLRLHSINEGRRLHKFLTERQATVPAKKGSKPT